MSDFDPQSYHALRELKQLAGNSNNISISSTELASHMGISQQSASRIILSLVDSGYITRALENRKQSITITDEGLNILFSELSRLSKILHLDSKVYFEGNVQSGLGEGRYYISRKYYIVQFQEKLGFIPYLGTLNIRIKPTFENLMRRLRSSSGIHIDGFRTEDRTFGPVKAFRATINSQRCAVILPERSVYSDILEVISEEYLRGRFKLTDGDELTVEVDLSSSE